LFYKYEFLINSFFQITIILQEVKDLSTNLDGVKSLALQKPRLLMAEIIINA
jgi:hypothetical protein